MKTEHVSQAPSGGDSIARARQLVRRCGFSETIYGTAMDFLIDECALLDEGSFDAWIARLTPDIFYWMPVRSTVMRKSGSGFDPSMAFLFETMDSLKFRVARAVKSGSAYAEDPGSRTRRFISNLVLHETEVPKEYAADTNILLMRNRGDDTGFEQISARREDILRLTDEGWRLAQRTILVDQTVLGTPNVAVFL